MAMSDLGRFVERQRMAHGWSQTDLANRIGRNQNYISRLEHADDDYPLPDPQTLRGLARAFGTSVTALLELAGYTDDEQEVEIEEVDSTTRVYTMLRQVEREAGLTEFQRGILREMVREAQRMRNEKEGALN